MSIKEEYIKKTLEADYEKVCELRKTQRNTVVSYRHSKSGKMLLVISMPEQNDGVFKALKGEKHNNLPMIYDVCCGENEMLVLEEFIEGENLASIISKEDLSKKRAVKYCLDVCEALKLLHSKRIIHRDIKPLNVMIDENDNAVLIDMQSSRLMSDEKSRDTQYLGTVGYAAPEQYGIFQSMPATDIYALGVMFNELLIGKHPSVEIPKGRLGKIVGKCTNINIPKRYQSVEALQRDLKKLYTA